MKKYSALFITLFFLSCGGSDQRVNKLEAAIDSLQLKAENSYRPGFGEFMSGIQVHHAKLWFAGINQNWELADFEMHEIRESLDAIRLYATDRPETKAIGMIDAPLDSVDQAIRKKDAGQFRNVFILLTQTCNQCHRETSHGFNVVTVPTAPPVVNQDFRPVQK